MFSIIVVSEGAKPTDGSLVTFDGTKDEFGHERLGGIGVIVANEIEKRTGFETRVTILGHIQRGGTPTAFDRWMATCYGSECIRALAEGKFGTMVAMRGRKFTTIDLATVLKKPKRVDPEGDSVRTARALGISFGDEL